MILNNTKDTSFNPLSYQPVGDLLIQVKRLLTIAPIEDAERVGSFLNLNIKEISSVQRAIDFGFIHSENSLLLGFSYARLSDSLRFNKSEITALNEDDRAKLRDIVKAGSTMYVDYTERNNVTKDDLPANLSRSSMSNLIRALEKAITEGNNFMIGNVANLLLIKAQA